VTAKPHRPATPTAHGVTRGSRSGPGTGFLRIQSKPLIGFHVKNYQHRYIPLAPAAREAIQSQLAKKHAASDFVFQRPTGAPWGDIGDSIDDLVAGADLQKEDAPQRLTPHSLRHTFASWLAIAGVSVRRIQELLGHKSITTTERYAHLGQNGSNPFYFELAMWVAKGFVPRFVTSPFPEKVADPRKLLRRNGGGAQTRTADLGIMRPSL